MTPLVVVCAWCQDLLPEAERAHGDNVSHGICDRHLAEIKAELAREGAAS